MSELRETRLEKAEALRAIGQGPYGLGFEPSHSTAALQAAHSDLPNGEERDTPVAVAGRVMTRRVMGKLAFFTLVDETGPIQLYLEKATLDAVLQYIGRLPLEVQCLFASQLTRTESKVGWVAMNANFTKLVRDNHWVFA